MLNSCFNIFNSKELSYFIWGLSLLAFLLFSKSIRKSFKELLVVFLGKSFLVIYVIAIAYIFLSVHFLTNFGIWKEFLLKDTVMWTIFVAFPLMWKAATIKDIDEFVSRIIKPLIAFSIVFEFILGLYSFELWLELIILPFMVFLSAMLAYSELKTEYQNVSKILKGIISILLLCIMGSILWHIINNYNDYLNQTTFLQFIVPLVLSFLLLPLLYCLSLYVHYESVFVDFRRHFRHTQDYWFAFKSAIMMFSGDFSGLGRWKNLVFAKNIQSRKEITSSMKLIKQLQKREKRPHTVNSNLGWSPYQAKDFLKEEGLTTSYYSNFHGDEFIAISNLLKLDKNTLLDNSISYSVSGTEFIAKELYLELKVYNSTEDKIALLSMFNICEVLFYKAIEMQPIRTLKKSIIYLLPMEIEVKGRLISLKKTDWTNLTKGYSLEFKITQIDTK